MKLQHIRRATLKASLAISACVIIPVGIVLAQGHNPFPCFETVSYDACNVYVPMLEGDECYCPISGTTINAADRRPYGLSNECSDYCYGICNYRLGKKRPDGSCECPDGGAYNTVSVGSNSACGSGCNGQN